MLNVNQCCDIIIVHVNKKYIYYNIKNFSQSWKKLEVVLHGAVGDNFDCWDIFYKIKINS